jgi:signal transduction histidine kinase
VVTIEVKAMRIQEGMPMYERLTAGVNGNRALSASLVHEINQPLSALQIHAQACIRWLSQSPPDIEAALASAERTARAGHRAAAVMDRIRRQAVRTEPVNLREEVDEALMQLECELQRHSTTVKVVSDVDLPLVRADRVAINQVLINLLRNGLQAMARVPSRNRTLYISLKGTAAGPVQLRVRDTGMGIEAGDLDRVFEPFFTTKEEGLGMGLAICRSLIEAMGGAISARNCGGGGAIFECVLPPLCDA